MTLIVVKLVVAVAEAISSSRLCCSVVLALAGTKGPKYPNGREVRAQGSVLGVAVWVGLLRLRWM